MVKWNKLATRSPAKRRIGERNLGLQHIDNKRRGGSDLGVLGGFGTGCPTNNTGQFA
jgi:hypothetical protein